VIYEAGSAKYHDHLMTVVSGGEKRREEERDAVI